MQTPVTRILRSSTRSAGDPLNILCFGATHERTEANLAKTGHRFYAVQGPGLKSWNTSFAPLPDNYTMLPGMDVPSDVKIDIAFSQTRGVQFDMGAEFSRQYRVPHVNLAHTLRGAGRATRGDVNVFISEYNRADWGFANDPSARVIEHGVDTDLFSYDRGRYRFMEVLAVANLFRERDAELGYGFFLEATRGLNVRVIGDNPGVSKPARNPKELAGWYKTIQTFANTASASPVPTSLLEAMACGCTVVTRSNPMIDTIIENEVNGFIADDPKVMRLCFEYLLEPSAKVSPYGVRARQTILDRFGLQRFVDDWNRLFEEVAGG